MSTLAWCWRREKAWLGEIDMVTVFIVYFSTISVQRVIYWAIGAIECRLRSSVRSPEAADR